MDRVEQMKKIQSKELELFTKKNNNYRDAFSKYGPIRVLHRPKRKIICQLERSLFYPGPIQEQKLKNTFAEQI